MPRFRSFKWAEWALNTTSALSIDQPDELAVDTETSGFGFYDEAFCATVAWVDGEGRVQSGYFELSDPTAKSELIFTLASAPKLVFHNAKFDLQKLIQAGILNRAALTPERIVDTECIAHLLDEHRLKKLKILARDILGEETDEDTAVAKEKKRVKKELGIRFAKDVGYHLLRREVIVPYALKDAEFTIRLFYKLWPDLIVESGLPELFASEMAVVLAALDTEAKGMEVDLPYLKDAVKRTNTAILRHEMTIAKESGLKVWYPEKSGQKTPEGSINPNSHDQVRAVLEARDIIVENTKKDTLKPLDDEFIRSLMALRGEQKLMQYLEALDKENRDGIVHPNFKLFKPKTGRTSSAGEDGD